MRNTTKDNKTYKYWIDEYEAAILTSGKKIKKKKRRSDELLLPDVWRWIDGRKCSTGNNEKTTAAERQTIDEWKLRETDRERGQKKIDKRLERNDWPPHPTPAGILHAGTRFCPVSHPHIRHINDKHFRFTYVNRNVSPKKKREIKKEKKKKKTSAPSFLSSYSLSQSAKPRTSS